MKIGHFGPTFIFPVKTVNFFGVKRVAPSSTLKMRKSHKKSTGVYAYTHAYTQIRDGGGKSASPPSLIGLTKTFCSAFIWDNIKNNFLLHILCNILLCTYFGHFKKTFCGANFLYTF